MLLPLTIDWVLRRTAERTTGGIIWSENTHMCDLDFADDIALIDETWASMQLTNHFNSGRKIQ